MKFSVVVPVYNVEKYIAPCIQSVLDQSWQDWELILVDDGSPDGSGTICDSYAARHPEKIRVIHKENGGVLLARETGIHAASGDILMFLDGDDCLRRDALEFLHTAFAAHNCQMIIFRASTSPDFSGGFGAAFPDGQIFEGESKQLLYEAVLTSSQMNSLCLKAFRRQLAEPCPEYAPFSFVKNGEDLLMLLPILTQAERIVYLHQNLYYYRQHPSSRIHRFNPARPASIKAVRQEVERYLPRWGMEALRPRHCAREVGGWMDALISLLDNRHTMDQTMFRELLTQLAEDDYFRDAYKAMDRAALEPRRRLLADLLYRRQYGLLRLLWKLRKHH